MAWLYDQFIGCIIDCIWGGRLYIFNERYLGHPAGSIFGEYLFRFSSPLYKKYGFIPFVTFTIWGGTIPMLVFLPGLGEEMMNASISATLSIVYLGLLPTVIPYFALAYVTSLVGASEATLSLYVTPALALIISWIWIGEIPTLISLLGGVVTVGGVCFTYLTPNKIKRYGHALIHK